VGEAKGWATVSIITREDVKPTGLFRRLGVAPAVAEAVGRIEVILSACTHDEARVLLGVVSVEVDAPFHVMIAYKLNDSTANEM
jgi:hypothetical protein